MRGSARVAFTSVALLALLLSPAIEPATTAWVEDYVYVDWGDVFREAHTRFFPDLETPAVSVGLGALGLRHILTQGGSGYFPLRVVQPLLDEERLYRVEDAPSVERPAYVVYGETPISPDLVERALEGLREVAGIA